MTPTATAPSAPQPKVNDVVAPPAPSVVDHIPVHAPGQPPAHHSDDAELDKIMQDVGRELRKDEVPHKKHRFWDIGPHHKKEPNFSTQMPLKNASAVQPPPVSHQPPPRPPAPVAPASHHRVKPVAQTAAKQQKPPKPPKQRRAPIMVTLLTIFVTAGLI